MREADGGYLGGVGEQAKLEGICFVFFYLFSYFGWTNFFLFAGADAGNFQSRTALLIRIIVWQGPTMRAVGAGRGCWDNFLISSIDDIVFLFIFSLFLEDGILFKSAV